MNALYGVLMRFKGHGVNPITIWLDKLVSFDYDGFRSERELPSVEKVLEI